MKRLYSFIALIAAVTMFTACGSDDASYNATPTLEVTTADVLFEAEGGDGSIVLNTTNTVTAATDASWLTLTVNGNKVIVTANPNISLEGRNAVIKLHAGNTEAQVTATQKSSIYGIPKQEYKIGDYQATLDIPVTHTQPVNVQSNTAWINATWNAESNKIEIVAENNDEAESREGTITITMGEYSDEITIIQQGFLLELEKEEVEVKNEAGTVSVNVNHSRDIETVESQADWIKASFNSKNSTLTCKVTANTTGWERIGTVIITSGPVTRTLTISQFDYEKNVLGEYDFVFFSGTQWASLPAELTAEELIIHVASSMDLAIPVVHDTEARVIAAGPSLSPIGNIMGYAIRLHFGFFYGSSMYFTSALTQQDGHYSYGELTTYEDSGTLYAMVQFSGSILEDDDMAAWAFFAYKDAVSTTTDAILTIIGTPYYYPYLERVVYEPSGEAKAYKAKHRNTTAPLGSKENPIPAFNTPIMLNK